MTTEEPIVLPARTSILHTQTAPAATPATRSNSSKKTQRNSFMGGWKLNRKTVRQEAEADDCAIDDTPVVEPPIGVGEGGGWIYRRRGSFSSPRPPSAEKAQHKAFAQEYRDFRKSQGSGSSKGSSGESSTEPASPGPRVTTFAARAEAAKPHAAHRRSFREKIEARFSTRATESPAKAAVVPQPISAPVALEKEPGAAEDAGNLPVQRGV